MGIKLDMPAHIFHRGDLLWLNATVYNKSETSYSSVKMFVFLDIGTGEYWFYPSWAHYPPDFDFQEITLPLNYEKTFVIIQPTYLPDINESIENCTFWAGLTDSNISKIIGEIDSWNFSIFK